VLTLRVLTLLSLLSLAFARGPVPRPITVNLLLPLSSSIREQAVDVGSGVLLALGTARLEFHALSFDWRLKSYGDESDTLYGKGLAELFRKALTRDAQVVGSVRTARADNYSRIVEDLERLKPDVVYFAADYDQVIPMLKRMRSAGLSSVVLGSDAMNTPKLAREEGQAAVGAYFTDIVAPANAYPRARAFVKQYRTQFGRDPSSNAVLGFDSMGVILQGLRGAIRAKTGQLPDHKDVAEAVRSVSLTRALTGEIHFNSAGDRREASIFILGISVDLVTRVNRVIAVRPPGS